MGGVVARHTYRDKVGIGFLAAIVAAANAGGAGSVIGDTTMTMIWIAGVSPLEVAPAFIGATAAFAVFGVAASIQQHRLSPIQQHVGAELRLDWMRLGLWAAIVGTSFIRKPDWTVLAPAAKGAIFLLALVAAASMMPVESLPRPSWQSVFGIGVIAAVFDNIPLTALALKQGGRLGAVSLCCWCGRIDFMVWVFRRGGSDEFISQGTFGGAMVKEGWHVSLAYILGFFVMLATCG